MAQSPASEPICIASVLSPIPSRSSFRSKILIELTRVAVRASRSSWKPARDHIGSAMKALILHVRYTDPVRGTCRYCVAYVSQRREPEVSMRDFATTPTALR